MNIPEEVKANFRQYENLKTEIKLLEKQCKELQPLLMEYVPEDGEIKTDNGTFTVRSKPSYVYSMDLQADEAELKDRKAREVQEGIATIKKGAPYLQYDPSKGSTD
jgi:hypothetical protein